MSLPYVARFKRWFASPPLPWFAHSFVPYPGAGYCPVLSSRARARKFWDRQASRVPLPDFGITFIGETFTASSKGVTPPSSLLRTHAPIPLALLSFGYSPRSRSLGRLLPAPAADGIFPTLCCESFLGCLVPCPGGPTERMCLFLVPCHRPSPTGEWVGFPLLSATRLLAG
jgi:hypothetical protein